MSRFGMTGRVVAKADREVDPYQHIDRLRQEVFDHETRMDVMDREIQGLKNANVQRWTESGVWKVVKAKLEEEAVDWMKWFVRGCAALAGTALLGLAAFVIKMAWKGLNA